MRGKKYKSLRTRVMELERTVRKLSKSQTIAVSRINHMQSPQQSSITYTPFVT